MITTVEIAPAAALAPFVHRYVYREFNTNGIDLFKPWVASYEISIHFFFKALPAKLINPVTGEILKTGNLCDILGMSSQYSGDMHFNGAYSFFQIIFKPGGFHQLFKIPSAEIVNRIICGEDIFNTSINLLHEQLYNANNSKQMAALADVFLLAFLNKHKPIEKNAVSNAVQLITKHAGFTNVDVLAKNANMSMRNFERSFSLATGVAPKLLCSIARFNRALELKLQHPKITWTAVAQHTGYFDQMHLIKDFKRFSGDTPKSLLNNTFLFEEKLITE